MLSTQGYGTGGQVATYGYAATMSIVERVQLAIRNFFSSKRSMLYKSERELDFESKRTRIFKEEKKCS